MSKWYVAIGEGQLGPLSTAELLQTMKANRLKSDAAIWADGWDDWKQARDVPELARYFVAAKPGGTPPSARPPVGTIPTSNTAAVAHAVPPAPPVIDYRSDTTANPKPRHGTWWLESGVLLIVWAILGCPVVAGAFTIGGDALGKIAFAVMGGLFVGFGIGMLRDVCANLGKPKGHRADPTPGLIVSIAASVIVMGVLIAAAYMRPK